MNTAELVAKIADAHGVSKVQAKSIVDNILKTLWTPRQAARKCRCRGSGSSKSRRRQSAKGVIRLMAKRSRLRRQRSSLSRPPNRSKTS
jgi:nucleoid DNA-binding protein